MIIFNGKTFDNSTEGLKKLYDAIDHFIENEDMTKVVLNELIFICRNCDDGGINYLVCNYLGEFLYPEVFDALIEKVYRYKYEYINGSVLWSINEFDYTSYFELIVDHAILRDDETFFKAISLIFNSAYKKIDRAVKQKCLKKVAVYIGLMKVHNKERDSKFFEERIEIFEDLHKKIKYYRIKAPGTAEKKTFSPSEAELKRKYRRNRALLKELKIANENNDKALLKEVIQSLKNKN